jgi:hypothetical protein
MKNWNPTAFVSALAGVIGGLGAAMLLGFSPDKGDGLTTVAPDGRLQYKWYAPQIPPQMSFAGEAVPLNRRDVREALDRELIANYYGHTGTLYALKLSSRWFPVIEPKLKAAGIPDDFKYLCIAESHLQNQTSKAGAVGFWQFMPGTAPQYGLEVSNDVDERYDVAKATDAACQYFRQAYQKFGNWTAAAASYNCGMGGYNGFATAQQQSSFYNILFLEETNRYIFRILALKHIIGNARGMGFIVDEKDAYKAVPVRTVPVSTAIPNLSDWALANGTTYKAIKQQNPWLRGKSLSGKPGKVYEIEIPTDL